MHEWNRHSRSNYTASFDISVYYFFTIVNSDTIGKVLKAYNKIQSQKQILTIRLFVYLFIDQDRSICIYLSIDIYIYN